MKIFKNFKKKEKFTKRTGYYFKVISILSIVGLVLIFISIYHFIELKKYIYPNFTSIFTSIYGYEFLTLLSLDFSIILIPVLISLNHIHKSFKEDKNKIFTLLEQLIMLRYDISDLLLEKKNTPLMIHPVIIRDIKATLRYFKFIPQVDYFHYLIKKKVLWQVDNIIKSVIIRTKSFDGGKEYRRRKNEVKEEIKDVKRDINNFSLYLNQEENPYKKKCIENLGFVLAYDLYEAGNKSIPVLFLYKDGN